DGFGNAINGFYDFADLSIETGRAVTIDGLVLSKERPSSGGRRTHVNPIRYRYDALGRMTSSFKDGLEAIQETHDYSGLCGLTRFNGVATHRECLKTYAQAGKDIYRGEEFNFEYDSLGQLNAVSDVGLKYSHDIHGQLVSTEGKNFE